MLAQRFAALLPEMTLDDALESAAIASLAGRFELNQWMQRPTRSPHHTATSVALVGGGVRRQIIYKTANNLQLMHTICISKSNSQAKSKAFDESS